jgi:hypothetical protein
LLNIRKKYACLVSGRLPGWKINLVMMFADPQLAAEKCVTLAPGVRRIVAGNAGLMTGPLAGPLAKRTGARLIGLPPPDDGRQDGAFAPDQLPGDGERLPLRDCRLTAIDTPGHASNCVCCWKTSVCCSPVITCSKAYRR